MFEANNIKTHFFFYQLLAAVDGLPKNVLAEVVFKPQHNLLRFTLRNVDTDKFPKMNFRVKQFVGELP
jgi:hypothetical protein